jgi:RNA polymerase sigma-70 factor, ECF subfamily
VTHPVPPPDDMDAELRALVEGGDLPGAATRFMQQHGGDILAFLAVRFQNRSDASEVFSTFTEDFWRGLEEFQWRTSLRSWAYTVARNAANRYLRSRSRARAHLVHLDRTPDCPQAPRSVTAPYLRTEVKRRMRVLRDQLPVEDQTLLVLRIDKGLSWSELAVIMSGEGEALSEADTARWAARLRQRFTTVKRRLLALAREEGLV